MYCSRLMSINKDLLTYLLTYVCCVSPDCSML